MSIFQVNIAAIEREEASVLGYEPSSLNFGTLDGCMKHALVS